MNSKQNNWIARHAWWLGGSMIWLGFNVLLIATRYLPQWFVLRQFNRWTALFIGNVWIGTIVVLSSLLLFVILTGNDYRRAKLLVVSGLGTVLWGWMLWFLLYRDVSAMAPTPRVPLETLDVLLPGLPLVWAGATFVAGVLWKPASREN